MKSARLYSCVRCHCQVIICSTCDRGNIYCGPICSYIARVAKHRHADSVYQKTSRGKQKHAQRQRRYRMRKKNKVTDQGSVHLPSNDLLPSKPKEHMARKTETLQCNFCDKPVLVFLRHGFLRHHKSEQTRHFSSWPLAP